jgi:pilus assembly protein CpaF
LRLNVVISGGTATGKTTLLNAVARMIPAHERVVTIEDAAELALERDNRVALEARPRNLEGAGQVGIRDLLRNALRMRPDRIVIGECRGGEALDMLQAMNTGHSGSLTSVHANSPRDALSRLEVMALMAGLDIPLAAIRAQIASSVDLVVQIERFACGSRRIVEITEVTGMEQGIVQTQQLFRFCRAGSGDGGTVRGTFEASPIPPAFLEERAW